MVHDWGTAEGKIFIPALLLPAIFFLLSGYPYWLRNARVDGHQLCHVFVIARHFCVNSGLILVAFVPTLDHIHSGAHRIEIFVHSFAASMAFVSSVASEVFVLVCHASLGQEELQWRLRALGFMVACIILMVIHKTLHESGVGGAYSEAWTFRYEMLTGSGLISQCQLIWHYSDPEPTKLKERVFVALAMMPYFGVMIVISSDFFCRNNLDALPWAALEVASMSILMPMTVVLLETARASWQVDAKVPLKNVSGYGTASTP